MGAIRAGDWKLLEYFEDGRLELYNLATDLSEHENLAAKQPERAAELRERLHAWRRSVDAALPTANPPVHAEAVIDQADGSVILGDLPKPKQMQRMTAGSLDAAERQRASRR